MVNRGKGLVHIETACIMVYALSVFIFPVRWVFGWIIAAAVHELGHLLALKLLKVQIYSLEIGLFGARIVTERMPYLKETLCALSGPLAGCLLLIFGKQMPYIALAAWAQSCYNLIPVYPLDGGRALRSLLCIFFAEKRAVTVSAAVMFVVIGIILATYGWISVRYHLGTLYVFVVMMPILLALWKNYLQCREKNSTIR